MKGKRKKRMKKIIVMLTVAAMLMGMIPLGIFAESSAEFSVTSDVASGEKAHLGDSITYTVRYEGGVGINAGTIYFKASDNLEFVSAVPLVEDYSGTGACARFDILANAGDSGVWFVFAEAAESAVDFCTVTYKVVGFGETELEPYGYDITDSQHTKITAEFDQPKISVSVETPSKPIITTESLKDGTLGLPYNEVLESDYHGEYATWQITSGELPEGLELMSDGTVTGTPASVCEKTFTVTVSILEQVVSDEKEITINIKELPPEITLKDGSYLTIKEYGDDGKYFAGVKDKTAVSALLAELEQGLGVKVFDINGDEITSPDTYVGTGCTVKLFDGDEVIDTVSAVVLGDLDGNGEIETIDYQRIRGYLIGRFAMTDVMLIAADVSGDGEIETIDYQRVRGYLIGRFNIYA